MKLRGKLNAILIIPMSGILLIFILGLTILAQFRAELGSINSLQNDRSTLLNADRDAYQAVTGEYQALKTIDEKQMQSISADHSENIQQAWDRVIEPSKNFDSAMADSVALFRTQYSRWKTHSDAVIDISMRTSKNQKQVNDLHKQSVTQFGLMRDLINTIGESVDNELLGNLSIGRRRSLESAQSLVLNGDRDAYQALTAQLQVLDTENLDNYDSLKADNQENAEQTLDRVSQAIKILDSRDNKMLSDFEGKYTVWININNQLFSILGNIRSDIQNVQTEQQKSIAAFTEMRATIDGFVGNLDEKVTLLNNEINQKISRFTNLYLLTLIITLFISLLFVMVLSNNLINRQLGRDPSVIVGLVDKLASGDLNLDVAPREKTG